MIKFNDAPFVPCNDCANWESCQEEAYKQGKADGYSQAEKDYYKQTEKDRQSSYDCGYQQGKLDGAKEFAKYVIDKIDEGYITHSSDIVDVFAEWQEGVENDRHNT